MPGAPRSDKNFFGLHLYFTGKYCKNLKVPLNVNTDREITWLVRVTIYRTFFNNNLPPPRKFLRDFYFIYLHLASYSRGYNHRISFCIERTWPPGLICTPITGCFHDKTIISKANLRLDCYLLLKYCRRQCTLLPPTRAKSLTKVNPIIQDFKRVLDLNSK